MSTTPTTTSRRSERGAPRGAAGGTRAGGFTLVELLVVLALFSVLLGIGVGAFRKVTLGRQLAVAQVKDALRAARLFAIEQSATARVEVDAAEGTLRAIGLTSVGNWHFEGDGRFGWPTEVEIGPGGEVVPDGAIGAALAFGGSDGCTADLGASPSFDADAGFFVECFVRVSDGAQGTILAKGEAFALSLGGQGEPVATVRVRSPGGTALPGAGEAVAPSKRLETLTLRGPDPLPPGAWTRLGLACDADSLVLFVGGIEQAVLSLPEPQPPVPDPQGRLSIGSEKRPWAFAIDEVRLASVVRQTSPPLPEGVRFAYAGAVHFDGRGRLDPARHREPVTISLLYDEDRRQRDVVVGLLGEVR